jgi:hypothetical protein
MNRPLRSGVPILLALGLAAAVPNPSGWAWERMDPQTMAAMSDQEVMEWALRQLGPHLGTVSAAAARHHLPPRLLAACILNELADYGLEDQLQELFFSTGSVGMIQMQVLRAIEYQRVDVPEQDLEACATDTLAREPLGLNPDQTRQYCRRYLTWERLNEPGPAVEAAARELDWILETMNANLGRPWQQRFLTGPIERGDPYGHVRAPSTGAPAAVSPQADRVVREQALAVGVCTAYNAPSIMKARSVVDEAGQEGLAKNAFRSARRHGRRAARLAGLLARAQVLGDPVGASVRRPGE